MSSTSPWASSATPRACERRCGGARGAPTPRPSPLQLCRGPSTPAPRPAPRILRHQPGHRAIRLPSPPTAVWDKGTLGGVLRTPFSPLQPPGPQLGWARAAPQRRSHSRGCSAGPPALPGPASATLLIPPLPRPARRSRGRARAAGGVTLMSTSPPNQPCPRVLPAGGTAWGQLGFFFTRFYFF